MNAKTFGMASRACGNILKGAGYIFDYDKWSWTKDDVCLFDGSGMTWAQTTYNAYAEYLAIENNQPEPAPQLVVVPDVLADYRKQVETLEIENKNLRNALLASDKAAANADIALENCQNNAMANQVAWHKEVAKLEADLAAAQAIIVQAGATVEKKSRSLLDAIEANVHLRKENEALQAESARIIGLVMSAISDIENNSPTFALNVLDKIVQSASVESPDAAQANLLITNHDGSHYELSVDDFVSVAQEYAADLEAHSPKLDGESGYDYTGAND